MSEHALPLKPMEGAGLALDAPACALLLSDLPRARGLEEAMSLADAARRTLIGPGLLTVNVVCSPLSAADQADATLLLQRIWTSDPVAYPVAGRKRKALTPWTRQLLLRGELFIGEGREALKSVFDDHALIGSLGLQSVINVPLFDGRGACFATFNVLGTEPRWERHAIPAAQLVGALCSPAIAQAAMAHAAAPAMEGAAAFP